VNPLWWALGAVTVGGLCGMWVWYRLGRARGWNEGIAYAAAMRAERERLAEEEAQREQREAVARRERIKHDNRSAAAKAVWARRKNGEA
jgi:hypothetical protein